MLAYNELPLEMKVDRLRDILVEVLKDLHYAPGLSSTAAMKLVLLEKDEPSPRS